MNPQGIAVERADGTLECWHQGRLHREDGPAVQAATAMLIEVPYTQVLLAAPVDLWFRRGRLHRTGAPAIEDSRDSALWYANGKLHRDEGPAIEDAEGELRFWFRDGQPHREG